MPEKSKSYRRWCEFWRFKFVYDRVDWTNTWLLFSFHLTRRETTLEIYVGRHSFFANYYNPKGASNE